MLKATGHLSNPYHGTLDYLRDDVYKTATSDERRVWKECQLILLWCHNMCRYSMTGEMIMDSILSFIDNHRWWIIPYSGSFSNIY